MIPEFSASGRSIPELSADQVARLRLQSQHLVGSALVRPVEAVRGMLAMQAQDFGAAQWAIGARVPGATLQMVAEALDSGEIVRSWPMRGTLHFVAAEDLGWILKLTSTRILKSAETRRQNLDLDSATLERAEQIAIETLTGNRRASREEMMIALESGGIHTDSHRSYHLIWFLAQTGVVCWGPMQANQQALVLLDEWVPQPRLLERDEALGEFVLRYIHGHGPATLKDFVWWTKLTTAEAKVGLAIARDHLVELRCNNTSYWMTAQAYEQTKPDLPTAKRSVLAVPAFDEFLLGYQDRSLVLPSQYAQRIVPGSNGVFLPTVVSGGTVVGTWRRSTVKSGITVKPVPFTTLEPRESKGFANSIEAYAKFLGKQAQIT